MAQMAFNLSRPLAKAQIISSCRQSSIPAERSHSCFTYICWRAKAWYQGCNQWQRHTWSCLVADWGNKSRFQCDRGYGGIRHPVVDVVAAWERHYGCVGKLRVLGRRDEVRRCLLRCVIAILRCDAMPGLLHQICFSAKTGRHLHLCIPSTICEPQVSARQSNNKSRHLRLDRHIYVEKII